MAVRAQPVEVVAEPVQALVGLLEALLAEARAGHIRAIAGVYETAGGSAHFRSIERTENVDVVRLLGQVTLLRKRLEEFVDD